MIGQIYKLQMLDSVRENVSPGSFVFPHDDAEFIEGFVSHVLFESNEMQIVLFEPTELPPNAVLVKESIMQAEMMDHLQAAIDENPFAYKQWANALHSN